MALLLVDYGWSIVVIGYSHARIIKPGVLQVKLRQGHFRRRQGSCRAVSRRLLTWPSQSAPAR